MKEKVTPCNNVAQRCVYKGEGALYTGEKTNAIN